MDGSSQKYRGLEKIKPLEIPECLRKPAYLGRKYEIAFGKDVPKKGRYFVKDVSEAKSFSHCGEIADVQDKISLDREYQVSEIINIKSEYRIYVVDGKIYTIANYNGDPTLLPDMDFIKAANAIYGCSNDYPQSYTMDVAVTADRTVLLECHLMFSCGIYTTVLGVDFLDSYIDGMRYLIA